MKVCLYLTLKSEVKCNFLFIMLTIQTTLVKIIGSKFYCFFTIFDR